MVSERKSRAVPRAAAPRARPGPTHGAATREAWRPPRGWREAEQGVSPSRRFGAGGRGRPARTREHEARRPSGWAGGRGGAGQRVGRQASGQQTARSRSPCQPEIEKQGVAPHGEKKSASRWRYGSPHLRRMGTDDAQGTLGLVAPSAQRIEVGPAGCLPGKAPRVEGTPRLHQTGCCTARASFNGELSI